MQNSRRLVCSVAAIFLWIFWISAAHADDAVCGDVNGSGSLSSADALLVLRGAVGQPVSLQCPALGRLLTTGQTSCWSDAGNPMLCEDTGQDGETRTGVATSYTDNGDGTITDNRTSLMWEKLDDSNLDGAAGIHDQNRVFTWLLAFTKIDELNAMNFAGYDDWRLPNVRELASLNDFGGDFLSVDPVFHTSCEPDCVSPACSCSFGWFWSSTTSIADRTFAYYVFTLLGSTAHSLKSELYSVRAVRGG